MDKKRNLIAFTIAILAGIVLIIVSSNPVQAPENKLPYDIDIISVQKTDVERWICWNMTITNKKNVIQDVFEDCTPVPLDWGILKIKLKLKVVTWHIYSKWAKAKIQSWKEKHDMQCWKYSKKDGKWKWIC